MQDIWRALSIHAAQDHGAGAYRLDFEKAAVQRVERAWVCPVTRLIFAYSAAGRSPYDPAQWLSPITLPRLPVANPGGLDPERRQANADWLETSAEVAALRRAGHWTNLHDRVAAYAPFLRVQEHSAQIERATLQEYEKKFREGRINLLSCSTTMEMGVDIPNVRLVVNANTPPSVSNYRQRVGRAGRRNEPWAFAVTYCRDLPLDRAIFDAPTRLLNARIPAPAVRLDSPAIVARHVHAFLLGAFLRGYSGGFEVRETVGAFLGVGEDPKQPDAADAPATAFEAALGGDWSRSQALADGLAHLTRATVLAGRPAPEHLAMTQVEFIAFRARWRNEYAELIARAEVADADARQALKLSAKRMRGEFLLGELARRGVTPAYGFPIDVVAFDHLSGKKVADEPANFAFGERRGGASRTLEVAIREYAPGAELVVDGLVHLSEGVRPAWSAMQDASGLEDLQRIWECRRCRAFGMARQAPEACPSCEHPQLDYKNALRPAGFMGRQSPHTGYERLGYVPFEMPRVTARGADWVALPNAEFGRFRADPAGEALTTGAGPNGLGYALCLACGRAEAETQARVGTSLPMPEAIRRHRPLAPLAHVKLVDGHCPGGAAQPSRIQANLHLAHLTRTDVFELELPRGADEGSALTLAAALREALCERLGADTREIGVAVAASQEGRRSAFLLDRANGGAGLCARLSEIEWLAPVLERARTRLQCAEDCERGCPACVLRPDLNFVRTPLDRPGGLALAERLAPALRLAEGARVFGPDTHPLGMSLVSWLDRRARNLRPEALTIWLHGKPSDWDLPAWAATPVLRDLKARGASVTLVLPRSHLLDRALDMATQLGLHQLATIAKFAHVEALPHAANAAPIVATVTDGSGRFDVAALDDADACPNETWGAGRSKPLVFGPAQIARQSTAFDTARLIDQTVGNVFLIRVGARIDGPASQFGERFWKLIAEERPLIVAALKSVGVREASYSDRYLRSPLSLLLLASVLNGVPGLPKTAPRHIATEKLTSPGVGSLFVYHDFGDDKSRSEALAHLLPTAQLETRARRELTHARILQLRLDDQRRLSILLDQGFGAWRCAPRAHDFSSHGARQARRLTEAKFDVKIANPQGSPMILEFEP